MQNVFTVGDMAVYPIHGITEVVAMESREIAGHAIPVYVLHVVDNGSTIMVPQAKAASVGLRGVISSDDADRVFALLREHPEVQNDQSWNQRKREYNDKLRSGDIYEVAQVLRELSLLGASKQLSFSERRMLETARNLLVQEIALVRETSADEVASALDAIFGDAA